MKKNWKYLAPIFMAVIAFLWVYNGNTLKNNGIELEKERKINGKINSINKPEGDKIVNLVFTDNTEYEPPFFSFNSLVEIGDSLAKESGSFKYVIFKQSNPLDTIIFIPKEYTTNYSVTK